MQRAAVVALELDIDNCGRTNDRGQKTKDWAGRRFAFNSHHPLSSVFCPLSLNSHNCTIGATMTLSYLLSRHCYMQVDVV